MLVWSKDDFCPLQRGIAKNEILALRYLGGLEFFRSSGKNILTCARDFVYEAHKLRAGSCAVM